MPNDQMTDSLRKLCYLHVQPLNQVSCYFVMHILRFVLLFNVYVQYVDLKEFVFT